MTVFTVPHSSKETHIVWRSCGISHNGHCPPPSPQKGSFSEFVTLPKEEHTDIGQVLFLPCVAFFVFPKFSARYRYDFESLAKIHVNVNSERPNFPEDGLCRCQRS